MKPAEFRPIVIRSIAEEMSPSGLSRRQIRAIDLASSLSVSVLSIWKKSWVVDSQRSSGQYRVYNETCNCPDDSRCKHLYAVEYSVRYVETIADRLGMPMKSYLLSDYPNSIGEMEEKYSKLLVDSMNYALPDEGLLHSVSLEAIGYDRYLDWMQNKDSVLNVSFSRAINPPPKVPWVAQIHGLCPQYEFRRDFVRPAKDHLLSSGSGHRGVWFYFHLPDGLFELQQIVIAGKTRRYFAEVKDMKLNEVSKSQLISMLCTRR